MSFLFYSTHGVTLGFGSSEQYEQAGTGESYAEGRQKGENQETETLGNTPGRGHEAKEGFAGGLSWSGTLCDPGFLNAAVSYSLVGVTVSVTCVPALPYSAAV